jgi:glycosyltransferase involved in cell wall biosynthesis
MATGVPVVASRHGGIPEAVVDGATGCLVDEGDVGSLARQLSDLLDDGAARLRISRAARAAVVDRFDVRACSRRLETVYDELTTDGRRRA